MSPDNAIVLSILVPLVGAGFILALNKRPNLRETATLVTATVTFLLVVNAYFAVRDGHLPTFTLIEFIPGVSLALNAEPIGMLFALLASFLWIITSIYAIGYMRGHHEKNQTRFYLFFAVAISCTLGLAFSANGFTLFFFYEALTLSTFPLVTHSGTEEAKRSGRVYLFVLLGTSVSFLLFALIWTWSLTGTVDFTPGGVFQNLQDSFLLEILLLLFVLGIGKAALMPFHKWLPAAMVAPTPVSALLHAVAVVKAGVFTVIKVVVYIFGIDLVSKLVMHDLLSYLAAFTVLATAIIAIRQDNLKRRLAYSTISQLSYIVLGAITASSIGIIGGGLHMVMHGFGKIVLFFGAGAILVAHHYTKVSELRGIGYKMPVTIAAFFVGTLCIIGVPPTGGVWSKWNLILGVGESQNWIISAALFFGPLLSVAYLMPISVRAFLPIGGDKSMEVKEAPLPILIAMVAAATGCVVLFFAINPLIDLLNLTFQ